MAITGYMQAIQKRNAKVLVVGAGQAIRGIVMPILKSVGFTDIMHEQSMQKAGKMIQASGFDLVLIYGAVLATHTLVDGQSVAITNPKSTPAADLYRPTIQLIDLIAGGNRGKNRAGCVFIGLARDDYRLLPDAYRHGLIGHFNHETISRGGFGDVFLNIMAILATYDWDDKAVALTQITQLQLEHGDELAADFSAIEEAATALIEKNPQSIGYYPSLIMAQAKLGMFAEAQRILDAIGNASDMSGAIKQAIDKAAQYLASQKDEARKAGIFSEDNQTIAQKYAIHAAAVIDSDEQAAGVVREELSSLGVGRVEYFKKPEDFMNATATDGTFDLFVMEWMFLKSEVTGAALAQRIRRSLPLAMIFIHSSRITPEDQPLLAEMSLARMVIPKPIGRKELNSFFSIKARERIKPDSEEAVFEQLQSMTLAKRLPEAEVLLQQLRGLSPRPHLLALGEALFEFEKGQFMDVVRRLRPFINAKDRLSMIYGLLGKSLIQLKDYKAATQCLSKAAELSPANVERACMLARIAVEQGDNKEAEVRLEKAKKLDKTSRLVEETAGYVTAIKASLGEGKKLPVGAMSRAFSSSQNAMIVMLARTGRLKEAVRLYEDLISVVDDKDYYVKNAVKYNKALALIRAKEQPLAVDVLATIDDEHLAEGSQMFAAKVKSLRAKLGEAIAQDKIIEISDKDTLASIRASTDFMEMKKDLMKLSVDATIQKSVTPGAGLRGFYHGGAGVEIA